MITNIVSISILFLVGVCSEFQKPTTENTLSITDNLVHQSGSGYVLFLNKADTSFYLLQTSGSIIIPASKSFVSFTNNTLTIKNLSTMGNVSYTLSSSIYGIGYMKGTVPTDLLTASSPGGIVIDFDSGDIESLSCVCIATTVTPACISGGEGATGCEITDGGSIGGIAWTKHCQVSCGVGYYACCNE